MEEKSPLDIVFDHLAAGEVAAALEWLSPDAHIWHCFDRIAHDREASANEWAAFVTTFSERSFTNARTQAAANGFVRQHTMNVRTASGKRLSWEVCVVVEMAEGLIKRLDEYIDRAGSYEAEAEAQ